MDDSSSFASGFPIDEACGTSSRFSVDQGEDLNEGNRVQVDEDRNDEESVVNRPFVGREFDSFDDAYLCYNTYALNEGFGVRISSTSKSAKTYEVISRKYVCDKEGRKDSNDKRQAGREVIPRRTVRVGCEAKMVIKLRDGKWRVTVFEEKHSHELTSPLRRGMHRSHNRLFKAESCRNLMDVFRVKKKNNMGQDAVIVADRLQQKRAEERDFFFSIELDTGCTLRSMFWADSRARDSYMSFSDVIVFDMTYRTNMYLVPFAPFTGVNHHRQSTLFGCALLADETEETLTWLFRQWLQCMHGKAPGTIITHMDVALRNAIRNVFPNTRHRFCSWHIGKLLVENVAAIRDPNSEFPKDYNRWYGTSDINECQMEWGRLVDKYKIDEKDWLAKMWELRTHWVPAYWRDTFTAGMTSSQRSESMNAFFVGFVNQKTSLHDFVDQYEKALADRRKKEIKEDFKSKNSKATMTTGSPLEEEPGKCYTRTNFGLFLVELNGINNYWGKKCGKTGNESTYQVVRKGEDFETTKGCTVVYNDSEGVSATCDCVMFETSGILCSHILKIFDKKQLSSIPEPYILRRWTIDARYHLVSGVPTSEAGNEGATPFRRWCLMAKRRRVDEELDNDDNIFNKLDEFYSGLLVEIEQRKKDKQLHSPVFGSQVQSNSVPIQIHGISIRDPEVVETKGRPSEASRLKSLLEVSQSRMGKRKCGGCGELGHNLRTCKNKAKMTALEDQDKEEEEEEEEEAYIAS
ncbi:protein FAR1-RELATED SEQUENCE 5-like [Tasmannia lanceolata]|uniref:protein FAR1-RELATED SEQUENCE 5-like n=1 Tax=Tasmannia lanceolata TaxID=3420 RepID=UPI00406441AE